MARGIASSTASGSNRGSRISEAPEARTTLVATNSPWVWKIGSAWISTSSLVNCQWLASVTALARRFAWESIAPFERPVVPEV